MASCSKCRYEYELVSGEIYGIESEEIRFVEVDYIYDYLLLYWVECVCFSLEFQPFRVTYSRNLNIPHANGLYFFYVVLPLNYIKHPTYSSLPEHLILQWSVYISNWVNTKPVNITLLLIVFENICFIWRWWWILTLPKDLLLPNAAWISLHWKEG